MLCHWQVRNGIDIMEKEPDVWKARVLILAAAYPDVNWSQVRVADRRIHRVKCILWLVLRTHADCFCPSSCNNRVTKLYAGIVNCAHHLLLLAFPAAHWVGS